MCRHHINVNIPLPLAAYKKLLGRPPNARDFQTLKPVTARGLQQLMEWPSDDVEDVFARTFVYELQVYGQLYRADLKEGGADVLVTKSNAQG